MQESKSSNLSLLLNLSAADPECLVFWQSERTNFGRSSEWWHQRGLGRNVICSVWISGCI